MSDKERPKLRAFLLNESEDDKKSKDKNDLAKMFNISKGFTGLKNLGGNLLDDKKI